MEALSDKTLRNVAREALIEAGSDVALLLEADGTIVDISVHTDSLRSHMDKSWRGKRWHETVSRESQEKIDELLANGEAPAQQWRQVNHPAGDGEIDVPIRYRTFALGRGNRLLGLGRDLTPLASLQQQLMAAQRAAEQDYWQLRQAESKYRMLFQSTVEAVLVLDAERMLIEEANAVAQQLFGWGRAPDNRSFWSLFTKQAEGEARALLSAAASSGNAAQAALRLKQVQAPLNATATLLRQGNRASYIIQLRTAGETTHPQGQAGEQAAEFFDAMPDAFVITDDTGSVRFCNAAFADLAALPNREQANGSALSQWLGRTEVDLNVLLGNLKDHGRVRFFSTLLRATHDLRAEVNVSAARLGVHSEQESYGFVIRDASGRNGAGATETASSRSIEELTELVGRVPLKELVRESSDLIERFSIEAALKLTGNNRAAAADMLGLSRQSLYVKMRRYDIADKRSSSG
ncbi:MAG: transcriptional regulator PpsR [Pseudomonadota bacterium]